MIAGEGIVDGHHVDDAVGKSRSPRERADSKSNERGRRGRLEHHELDHRASGQQEDEDGGEEQQLLLFSAAGLIGTFLIPV